MVTATYAMPSSLGMSCVGPIPGVKEAAPSPPHTHSCGDTSILKNNVEQGFYNKFHRARFRPSTHCVHFIGEMVMSRVLFLALLLSVAFSSRGSQPQINVGLLFDYMPPESGNVLKRIRNTGDATAYVRVEVVQMHFDANGQVTESAVDTTALARSSAGAQGVIASPGRLIIAAHGQQATRLVYRGPRDEERYYRLRFIPVAPTADEFALSEAQASEAAAVASAVQVFTGFGTVLFIAPEQPRYNTRIESGQVHNDGNATIVLSNLRHCQSAEPDRCSPGTIVHVRPGRSHVLEEAPGQFSRYELREGSSRRMIDSRR